MFRSLSCWRPYARAGIADDSVFITAHNVVSNYFQLLSKTNLNDLDWKIEQQFQTDGGAEIALDPVPQTNSTATKSQMFFLAAQSGTLIKIELSANAVRPNPNNNYGQPGYFTLTRDQADYNWANPLTVYYRLSGTASNGVDYIPKDYQTGQTLTNSFTFPPFYYQATIEIDAFTNALAISNLTVTLTLERTDGYLPNSNGPAATMLIEPNVVTPVAPVLSPSGIDYHPPTHSLIVTVDWFDDQPYNLVRIDTNGLGCGAHELC